MTPNTLTASRIIPRDFDRLCTGMSQQERFTRRDAFLGALKFQFHGLLIERSARACTKEATRHLWQIAKHRAAQYALSRAWWNL